LKSPLGRYAQSSFTVLEEPSMTANRKLAAALAAAFLSLGVAACEGDTTEPATDTGATPGADTVTPTPTETPS
jgi:hypothetical protein